MKTVPYQTSPCPVFLVAHISPRAVRPMTGNNSEMLRKTLAIDIEIN